MNQTRAVPWVIDILDDGLRIYRRFLSAYVLAAAIAVVPLLIFGLITNGLVQSELGASWSIISALLSSPITFFLLVYAFAVLSRMTNQVVAGERPQLRAALPIRPTQLLGMGCSTILFLIGMGLTVGIVGAVCSCLGVTVLGFATAAAFTGSGVGVAGFSVLFAGLAVLAYIVSFSGVYTGMVYAVQSFALEPRGFGASLSRSFDLLFFRFGRNLLCMLGAGAIVATLGIAFVGTLAAVGQLVITLLDIDLSPTLSSVLLSLLSTVPLIVLTPPLPIWMALLHIRLRAERDGGDLPQRIATWVAPQPAAS